MCETIVRLGYLISFLEYISSRINQAVSVSASENSCIFAVWIFPSWASPCLHNRTINWNKFLFTYFSRLKKKNSRKRSIEWYSINVLRLNLWNDEGENILTEGCPLRLIVPEAMLIQKHSYEFRSWFWLRRQTDIFDWNMNLFGDIGRLITVLFAAREFRKRNMNLGWNIVRITPFGSEWKTLKFLLVIFVEKLNDRLFPWPCRPTNPHWSSTKRT